MVSEHVYDWNSVLPDFQLAINTRIRYRTENLQSVRNYWKKPRGAKNQMANDFLGYRSNFGGNVVYKVQAAQTSLRSGTSSPCGFS
ncbi:hypothetical protein [Parasitella parasitica]|uniref:Uncharacterized protein n=1 Tax=Parasitella parasitica TaxID=35722 RepID=A0A0B7NVN7_9FUNG|nr:hypothetical protein [Parasitella parasitica]